ncbi:DUF3263 domain-containing protein [Nocardia sp. NPDC050789]|uniref:DUF3263 domain-containing protein n=1 Tax=Nocardia sp. NPDC050789 TaxID=3154841 RepID=UPI0033DB42FF
MNPVHPFEIEMLEFAAEWAPYGGNDDAAFVRFGLTPEEFHRRLARLLVTPTARTLDNATIARLRAQCADRSGGPARR